MHPIDAVGPFHGENCRRGFSQLGFREQQRRTRAGKKTFPSGAIPGREDDARLRPVAQDTAHDPSSARARLEQRIAGILKSNLDADANFQHFIRREKQAGLTHVDGLTHAPALLLCLAITQGNAQVVAYRPRYDCPALTWLVCHARVPFIHVFSVEIICGPSWKNRGQTSQLPWESKTERQGFSAVLLRLSREDCGLGRILSIVCITNDAIDGRCDFCAELSAKICMESVQTKFANGTNGCPSLVSGSNSQDRRRLLLPALAGSGRRAKDQFGSAVEMSG